MRNRNIKTKILAFISFKELNWNPDFVLIRFSFSAALHVQAHNRFQSLAGLFRKFLDNLEAQDGKLVPPEIQEELRALMDDEEGRRNIRIFAHFP